MLVLPARTFETYSSSIRDDYCRVAIRHNNTVDWYEVNIGVAILIVALEIAIMPYVESIRSLAILLTEKIPIEPFANKKLAWAVLLANPHKHTVAPFKCRRIVKKTTNGNTF